MYGKTVNYISKNNQENLNWQIFYADENNIYLIASDYVSDIPKKNGYDMTSTTRYKKCWNENILSQYDGIDSIDISLFEKYLSYISFLENNMQFNRKNNNMLATAYMLDTEIWTDLYGEEKEQDSKVKYVIGGPTLDMFCLSYNLKHKIKQIVIQSDEFGYKVSEDKGINWNYYLEGLNTSESQYVINNNTKANAMWFASPSAETDNYMMTLTFKGAMYTTSCLSSESRGFRPVVCLNSDVKLIESGDNEKYDYDIIR